MLLRFAPAYWARTIGPLTLDRREWKGDASPLRLMNFGFENHRPDQLESRLSWRSNTMVWNQSCAEG